MTKPYKYVQTLVPTEESDEIDAHILKLKEKGTLSESGEPITKREWIRDTLLKEVRGNEQSLPLHK